MENTVENKTIGKYLGSIRENKNLTLEDVSEITKIKVRILKQIEGNLFDDLGGIGYAKAMILTYAKALKISDDEVHRLLQIQFNDKSQHIPKSNSSQPRKFFLPTKIFSILLLIVVIALLSFLVINLYQDGILTWPPFKKADVGMEITPKEKTEEPAEDNSKNVVPKSEKKDEMVMIEQLEKNDVTKIDDNTDLLDELLFKDRKSPFNYDE